MNLQVEWNRLSSEEAAGGEGGGSKFIAMRVVRARSLPLTLLSSFQVRLFLS